MIRRRRYKRERLSKMCIIRKVKWAGTIYRILIQSIIKFLVQHLGSEHVRQAILNGSALVNFNFAGIRLLLRTAKRLLASCSFESKIYSWQFKFPKLRNLILDFPNRKPRSCSATGSASYRCWPLRNNAHILLSQMLTNTQTHWVDLLNYGYL